MSDPRLDSRVLATLQEVMEGDYPMLLDAFLTDSEARLRLLHGACDAGEADLLRQTAHSFKGSCSNMGAVALADLCRQLEELAGGETLCGAAALIDRIEREAILFVVDQQNALGRVAGRCVLIRLFRHERYPWCSLNRRRCNSSARCLSVVLAWN